MSEPDEYMWFVILERPWWAEQDKDQRYIEQMSRPPEQWPEYDDNTDPKSFK